MKILYAIQGTGNGHIARAIDIVPHLEQHGTVDLFVSGAQATISLPFPVKYKSKGLSFFMGGKGGINFLRTFKENSSRQVIKEINSFPVEKYDLIVNDFEPISAWAARQKDVPLVALGHQAAFLSDKTPRPHPSDPFGEWILHRYAPAKKYVGFHFKSYDKNIYTPVIRSAVRDARPGNKWHCTVYLPAYDDKKLVKWFLKIPHTKWHIFSRTCKTPFHVGDVSVYPVSNEGFVTSLLQADSIICGAGFETPAEVLHLNKKLLVIPMRQQYEQKCNALALRKLGVARMKRLRKSKIHKIEQWLEESKPLDIWFPDTTAEAVARAVHKF